LVIIGLLSVVGLVVIFAIVVGIFNIGEYNIVVAIALILTLIVGLYIIGNTLPYCIT
jgi:hypothetical protein